LNLGEPGCREKNFIFHSLHITTAHSQPLPASTCGPDRTRTQISKIEWKELTDNTWVSEEAEKKKRGTKSCRA
jgi:hypothetical protein